MPKKKEKLKCEHCKFIDKIFNFNDMSNREYWLMTEVFLKLHGRDYCVKKEKGIKTEIPNVPKEERANLDRPIS